VIVARNNDTAGEGSQRKDNNVVATHFIAPTSEGIKVQTGGKLLYINYFLKAAVIFIPISHAASKLINILFKNIQ